MNLIRIWETLTGRPHQHHNAGMIRSATMKLQETAERFSESIKPYKESEDTVAMLFRDIDRQRATATRSENESKHHS